jgi:hypothetical protein
LNLLGTSCCFAQSMGGTALTFLLSQAVSFILPQSIHSLDAQ